MLFATTIDLKAGKVPFQYLIASSMIPKTRVRDTPSILSIIGLTYTIIFSHTRKHEKLTSAYVLLKWPSTWLAAQEHISRRRESTINVAS